MDMITFALTEGVAENRVTQEEAKVLYAQSRRDLETGFRIIPAEELYGLVRHDLISSKALYWIIESHSIAFVYYFQQQSKS